MTYHLSSQNFQGYIVLEYNAEGILILLNAHNAEVSTKMLVNLYNSVIHGFKNTLDLNLKLYPQLILTQVENIPDFEGFYAKYGRTTSSRELSHHEAQALISHLNRHSPAPAGASVPAMSTDAEKIINMRKKMYALAWNTGYWHWQVNKRVLDYTAIDRWCLTHTTAKKRLNDMNKTELAQAITAFSIVNNQYLLANKELENKNLRQ